MKKYLVCSLLLSACAHIPPAIENAPSVDLSYGQVVQNVDAYKNSMVRWGGVILDVENQQYQSLIQVLQFPLNSSGRPNMESASSGRFIIKSPSFLDPAVYLKSTEVTVSGVLAGTMEKVIDKKTLKLPVVLSSVIYLWPKYEPDYYGGYGGFGGFGGYGGFGPYGGYYGGIRNGWYGGYPYYGGRGYYSPHYAPRHRLR